MTNDQRVGQDVPGDDPESADAERFGRRDVLVAPDRQHQAADDARQPRPPDEGQNRDDAEIHLLAWQIDREHRAQRDDQVERRDAEQQLGAAHDHRVGHAAEVPGDAAEQQPERERDQDADQADRERHLTAVEQPRELVAAERVGSEQVDAVAAVERRTGGHCRESGRGACSRRRARRTGSVARPPALPCR